MKTRPAGVTVLAVLAFIGAALGLFGALSGGIGAGAFGTGPVVALLFGLYSLILAVFYLVFAFGLWRLKPWAWMVGIVCLVLSILGNLYSLVTGNLSAILSLVVACAILWYLFQPHVKQAFGR